MGDNIHDDGKNSQWTVFLGNIGHRAGCLGLVLLAVLFPALLFEWIDKPLSQFAAGVVLLLIFGGFGLMGASFTNHIGMFLLIVLALFLLFILSATNIPLVSVVAKLLWAFLFRG